MLIQHWHQSWTQYSTDSLLYSSALCSFATFASLCHPHLSLRYTQHTNSPWHSCPSLAVCWPYVPLFLFLESSISFPHEKVLAYQQPWHQLAMRGCTLLGTPPLCYTASSLLLVLSSSQVWRQSVQVDDNHLCTGILLNLVYDVVYLDDNVWAFSVRLQLGWSSLMGRW